MQETSAYVPMVVCPRPFTFEGRQLRSFAPGQSIAQLMRHCGLDPDVIPARVFLDDQLIESAYWHRVKPKAGHLVSVRVIPEGGGQGKDVLRIVAMVGVIALAIAAPWAAGLAGSTLLASGTIGGALLTAGVGIVGSLAMSGPVPALLPRRITQQSRDMERRLHDFDHSTV
jgi:hypothetical protein